MSRGFCRCCGHMPCRGAPLEAADTPREKYPDRRSVTPVEESAERAAFHAAWLRRWSMGSHFLRGSATLRGATTGRRSTDAIQHGGGLHAAIERGLEAARRGEAWRRPRGQHPRTSVGIPMQEALGEGLDPTARFLDLPTCRNLQCPLHLTHARERAQAHAHLPTGEVFAAEHCSFIRIQLQPGDDPALFIRTAELLQYSSRLPDSAQRRWPTHNDARTRWPGGYPLTPEEIEALRNGLLSLPEVGDERAPRCFTFSPQVPRRGPDE